MCVCERERERVCVCVCACVRACVCLCLSLWVFDLIGLCAIQSEIMRSRARERASERGAAGREQRREGRVRGALQTLKLHLDRTAGSIPNGVLCPTMWSRCDSETSSIASAAKGSPRRPSPDGVVGTREVHLRVITCRGSAQTRSGNQSSGVNNARRVVRDHACREKVGCIIQHESRAWTARVIEGDHHIERERTLVCMERARG